MSIRLWALFGLTLIPYSAFAQHEGHHAHSNSQSSSLSVEEVSGLLEGRGMGLARSAELNGYPGPLHVLELADALGLTSTQRTEAQRLREAMLAEAIPLGERIVERERHLDMLFEMEHADSLRVDQLTGEIGALRAALRAVHLKAHLGMYNAMTAEQRSLYAELRGYTSEGQHMPMHDGMSSALFPGAPMTRDGSGTGRLPDTSPMEAIHTSSGEWSFMLHGVAFPRYTSHDAFGSGSRGDSRFDAPNWVMGMAQRPLGSNGQITLRAMPTLDPLTEGGEGYPLLFQTGETFEGERLIDRQHPHDLFAELSAIYAHRLSPETAAYGYVAYPGEPALGPVAFMHRPSARHNPNAPLGHHWQDATHIAWGVATAGLAVGPAQLEASVFTGREPNEQRYDFETPRFDSFSGRVSLNATENLALQLSSGLIKQPESLEPGVDVLRMTASAVYSAGAFSGAFVWGMNRPEANDHADEHTHAHDTAHAFLVEGDVTVGRQAFFGRAEWVQKPDVELGLPENEESFSIGALTVGTAREFVQFGGLSTSLGAQGTFYAVPDGLQSLYGSNPVSLEVFLRISPSQMMHGIMN